MNHPNISSLPPLPPIPTNAKTNNHNYKNQINTDFSFSPYANWLIPNKILVGESPSLLRSTTSQKIQSIVQKAKCTTFVCLQTECPPQTKDTVDMGGYKDWKRSSKSKTGPSYCYYVRNIGKQMGEKARFSFMHYGIRDVGKDKVQFINDPQTSSSSSATKDTSAVSSSPSSEAIESTESFEYVHYPWNIDTDHLVNDPLPPSSTTATASPSSSAKAIQSNESFRNLIQNLAQRVLTGNEILYIHCGDGIQRSNLVAAGLLGFLYPNLDVEEAMRRVILYWETRMQHQQRMVCEKNEKQEERLYVPRGGWIGCVARDRCVEDWWKMVKEEKEKEEEEERLFIKPIVESNDSAVLDEDVNGNEEKLNKVEINEEDGVSMIEHQKTTPCHDHHESIEEHTLEIESNDTISSLSWTCSSSSSEDPQSSPLYHTDEVINKDENDNDDNSAESSHQPMWNDNPVPELAEENNKKLQRPSTASTVDSYASSSTLSSLLSGTSVATAGSRNDAGVKVVRHSSRVKEIKNRLRSMEQRYRVGRVGE